ncbi:MAG TPA: hypothetical protein VMJ32_06595 [Pirellulales bacterium]|nr:hypothetical protein [Pirellulales bacterium]
MTQSESSAVLNRLFVIIYRSLPMYLADAVPWMHSGDEQAKHVLNHIVADYRMYSGRIAELLLSRRQRVSFGEYPMVFTDTHDLSLDYMISELIDYQKQDVTAIEKCVADLKTDLAARILAEEVLGNARGHLESLEESLKQLVTAP